MKKVCPKCGNKKLHKHGKKRRKCVECGHTCTVGSGRKRSKVSQMYLLDRSTLRRIAYKMKCSPSAVMKKVMNEIEGLPTPLQLTKNFKYL